MFGNEYLVSTNNDLDCGLLDFDYVYYPHWTFEDIFGRLRGIFHKLFLFLICSSRFAEVTIGIFVKL